uniref:Uncharacterized protein n=1 Tax=Vespula pensylvanica TaxID=30213 RepID=A0A834N2G9_VESPE|nr:hypothetical protein H0235_016900 [Vespula pensylvanica]
MMFLSSKVNGLYEVRDMFLSQRTESKMPAEDLLWWYGSVAQYRLRKEEEGGGGGEGIREGEGKEKRRVEGNVENIREREREKIV